MSDEGLVTSGDASGGIASGVEVAVPDGAQHFEGGVPARRADPVDPRSLSSWTRFWAWWMPKAGRIAAVQNRALAWLTFHLGLRPVAFFIKRQDRLDRAVRPVGASGWHPRPDAIPTDPQRIRRPV